jgi:ppGpp synthetase/RelA/SpoT-type nucleotidyltranferase
VKKIIAKEEKLLSQYEQNLKTYKQFARLIDSELKKLLKKYKFFYQVTQRRVKSKKSLTPKLSRANKLESINDIVACRVIFYRDSDIQKFANLLYSHFKIVDFKPKYSEDNYNADHYIVSLSDISGNKKYPENFLNLKCEIQLTTVLFHAWSEMEHDVIYKPQEKIRKFDEKAFESLNNSFKETMKNHIKEASFRFEHIYESLKDIEKGVEIFDLKNLQKILKLKSNNEIIGRVALLKDYIRKYNDKIPDQIGLINFIKDIIKKAQSITTVEPIFGRFPGHTTVDVIIVCLEILNLVSIRYKYFSEIFEILLELSKIPDQVLKEKVYEIAQEMSGYHYFLVSPDNAVFLDFQKQIIDKINSWKNSELINHDEFIIKILEPVFEVNFRGEKWVSHDSFTNIEHTFTTTSGLQPLRESSLKLLKKLFKISGTKTRIKILETFHTIISNLVYDENYKKIPDSKINDMVQEQTAGIIAFYLENFSSFEPILWLMVDKQLRTLINWYPDLNILPLKNLINLNDSFQDFKAITSIHGSHSNEEDKFRDNRINDFVNKLTDNNKENYKQLILHINEFKDEDKLNIYFFEVFLNKLSVKSPEFLYEIFETYEEELKPEILSRMANQLFRSKLRDKMLIIIKHWIENNKNLEISLQTLEKEKIPELEIIETILQKAIKNNDSHLLNEIIKGLIKIPESKKIILMALQKLTELENAEWAGHSNFYKLPLFKELTDEEIALLLKNLEYVNHIDNSVENILYKIAEKDLKLILRFFYNRIKANKRDRFEGLNNLMSMFRKSEDLVFDEILSWEENYFQKGANLLRILILETTDNIKIRLENIINNGSEKELDNLMEILDFQVLFMSGSFKLPEPIKDLFRLIIINHYPKYREKLFNIFGEPGLISGWDGYSKAFQRKKDDINDWETDPNEIMKKFIREYKNYLEKDFAYHQKNHKAHQKASELKFKSRQRGNDKDSSTE